MQLRIFVQARMSSKRFPGKVLTLLAGRPMIAHVLERCGQAFGVDLYGVDIIESGGAPYVVDMCSIPGFKGVPDAIRLLAQYFCTAAERAARGELSQGVRLTVARNYARA